MTFLAIAIGNLQYSVTTTISNHLMGCKKFEINGKPNNMAVF